MQVNAAFKHGDKRIFIRGYEFILDRNRAKIGSGYPANIRDKWMNFETAVFKSFRWQ